MPSGYCTLQPSSSRGLHTGRGPKVQLPTMTLSLSREPGPHGQQKYSCPSTHSLANLNGFEASRNPHSSRKGPRLSCPKHFGSTSLSLLCFPALCCLPYSIRTQTVSILKMGPECCILACSQTTHIKSV